MHREGLKVSRNKQESRQEIVADAELVSIELLMTQITQFLWLVFNITHQVSSALAT